MTSRLMGQDLFYNFCSETQKNNNINNIWGRMEFPKNQDTVSAGNRITLGQRKSDNNNRMIHLTDVFCVLLSNWGIMGPVFSDYNMQLILLSVIQLSGGHCTCDVIYRRSKIYLKTMGKIERSEDERLTVRWNFSVTFENLHFPAFFAVNTPSLWRNF